MTANAKIQLEHQENVLTVPTHALFRHGGKCYAIVTEGSRYEARELKIGSCNGTVAVVLAGLGGEEKLVAAAFKHMDLVTLPPLAHGEKDSGEILTHVDERFTDLDTETLREVREQLERESREKIQEHQEKQKQKQKQKQKREQKRE